MPDIRMIYNNEKGFVLPLGLMFLAIISILGTSAVTVTTTDLKIGSNYKRSVQAFYAAEAGAQHAINILRASTGFNNELLGSDGSSGTSDDGILSFGSSVSFGGGTYEVQVTDNDDDDGNLFDDVDGKVIIASIGTLSGAKQTINVMFGTGSFNPDGALGVYGPNNPTITIQGSPIIDGWDYNPPTNFNCSGANCNGTVITPTTGVVGLYTEQSSPTVDGTVSPDLSSDPNVDGNPANQYSGGNNTDWQAVANKLIPQADNTYTGSGNVAGNIELGNRTSPEITVVTTSSGSTKKFVGNVDGAGVLIIQGDGDAHFAGSFHWEGIIIVLSNSSNAASLKMTGNAHVFGSLVSAGTATANLDFTGNPDIVYSSQALTYANDVYKIIYSWKDDSL